MRRNKRKLISFVSCFIAVLLILAPLNVKAQKNQLKLGVEVLLEEQKDLVKGKNVGLITNPTGVNSSLDSIVDLIHEDPDINLVAMYGPEHGVRGDAQAGASVESYIDEQTGVIVHSLYGNTRKPTPEMLEGVDTLIFDIQDVGARFYTYIYTMSYAMEAAQENDIDIIILDRPNPLGGNLVAGPILEPDFSSFVGRYPIPVIHGMTVGELAKYFNDQFQINANLTVVPMKNWDRDMFYDDTNLQFVLPSPNMPTTETTLVYPGTCLFEGTNLSEGRGTTKPFELIGAPFINAYEYSKELNSLGLPGVQFRAASFTPTMSKHSGELVHGVEVHVKDKNIYRPLETGLKMIIKLQEMYPNDLELTNFFNTLMGNSWVRQDILAGKSYEEISAKWNDGLNEFKERRQQYLIYHKELDYSVLESLIDEAEALDLDNYTEASVKDFQKVLTEAKELINKASNQESINNMVTQLEDAIKNLEKIEVILDYSVLESLIDEAEALDLDNYTEASVKDFQKVLAEARELIDNSDDQESIDNMVTQLEDAIKNLEKIEVILDYSTLKSLIDEAEALDLDNYTEASVKDFQRILAEAKELIDNADDQESIDSMVTRLQEALEGLIEKETGKPTPPDKSDPNGDKTGKTDGIGETTLPKSGEANQTMFWIIGIGLILAAPIVNRKRSQKS